MDIWEVIRRWHNQQGIREISRSLAYDRKTIRNYISFAIKKGLSLDLPLPPREEVLLLLQEIGETLGRTPKVQFILQPYLTEITELINDPDVALKPKSVFDVICERHELAGKVSYTSYKRFIRTHELALHPKRVTCRIEVAPGSQAQIDYARVALWFDPSQGRRRTLYAFIGTLSHSRMKFVELTFSQNQTSFVNSHIRMFDFYGGVPSVIIIDNLKSGVIKPDLYDPSLNRAYREAVEHYDCFIDTARPGKPKDKGKVERDVQTVREAVRKIMVLHPGASLAELNRLIKHWALEEYGQKMHGTTREKPAVVFAERERPALKVLPAERYEVAEWKQATVHPDHYIQFKGKPYSIPTAYVGRAVWIRASERILQVFFREQLIKQHAITSAYRHTDFNDFPENVRAVLDTSTVHRSLLERAQKIGPNFHQIVHGLLTLHAFINLRRAQGLLGVAEGADPNIVEIAARFINEHNMNVSHRELRQLVTKFSAQALEQQSLPFSDDSREFVRDINYFINKN
jgi:transposase